MGSYIIASLRERLKEIVQLLDIKIYLFHRLDIHHYFANEVFGDSP